MKNLKAYINSKVNIKDNDLENILAEFKYTLVKKNESLIRFGQYINDYYFIEKGGARLVIETPEKEITAWILLEGDFISNIDSIRRKSPSNFRIIALEDSEVYSINSRKMHEFYRQYPPWQTFGRVILEDAFLNVIDILVSFQIMDAEERYLKLLQQSEIINRVPLKQLASYLGITPNSLSRIRKNINKNN